MKINITCGQIANNHYSKKYKESFIPFNEAMIEGNPKEDIFSEKFIQERVKTLNTTLEDYISKMNSFLNLKEKIHQYNITCWFGDDDFCKMNLLTILAYLEQLDYQNEITFNLIDEYTFKIKETKRINPKNYKQKYLDKISSKETQIIFE